MSLKPLQNFNFANIQGQSLQDPKFLRGRLEDEKGEMEFLLWGRVGRETWFNGYGQYTGASRWPLAEAKRRIILESYMGFQNVCISDIA